MPQQADWIIEEAFDRTGAEHMARDEELARERIGNEGLPNVLRLYSWRPAAVSIGYEQSMDAIDLEACERAGIDVVRRPTGGRAVLHANELTYAVVMRYGTGIYSTHNVIVRALLNSFASLGRRASALDLTQRAAGSGFRQHYMPGALTNAACFASSARHEVLFDGKKVIGSAARRFSGVFLQHGSILLANDHLQLPDLLRMSDTEREAMRLLLTSETATLSDVLGRTISIPEAAAALRERFVNEICELLACQQPGEPALA